jgi:hypothetical protein
MFWGVDIHATSADDRCKYTVVDIPRAMCKCTGVIAHVLGYLLISMLPAGMAIAKYSGVDIRSAMCEYAGVIAHVLGVLTSMLPARMTSQKYPGATQRKNVCNNTHSVMQGFVERAHSS